MSHTYRQLDVPVDGGLLHAGVWETDAAADAPSVLAVHGVTASHLAWPFVAERLPGVRVVAPDLRGRGRSNGIEGSAGMAAHADDLAALLDALGIDRTVVVGHSMGAFVSVVFAARHAERVSRLVLVDGGLPLDVPAGMDTDALVAGILGPTAARLSMTFADTGEYLDFWRRHPAFTDAWTPELERYLAYDLVDDGAGAHRPATSYATTADDTVDMNTGTTLPDALAGLRHPTRLITVPRGLQNEPPGLYAPAHLDRVLAANPSVRHERVEGFNHYTIVMSPGGADVVAAAVQEELAAVPTP
ncbi:alpha/beta hydrolase [Microbacterium sp. CFH 31415]|uniref:alpha/beta fold hydrolase n=1 Tax=Microbacterium sp. CFH 31415 TaxID=2921732 RepID=UPI001F1305DD|nr:alpha/beta hydrolase [Microbacterium sp. CFH 31415]MCH6229229.1 alpha/beta hydrolase [Microbacterium sp. CFH 31415]